MPSEIVWRPNEYEGSTAYRGEVAVGRVAPFWVRPQWNAWIRNDRPNKPMWSWYSRHPDEASARAYVESKVREAGDEG